VLTSHDPIGPQNKHTYFRSGGNNHTFLHLRDQLLIKETLGPLVQWAVDGYHVALGNHLLETTHSATSNVLLNLRFQRLIVEIQKLLTVKRLQPSQYTFTNTANSHGPDNLALEVVLAFGRFGDVPIATLNLFMCWDEITDKAKDSHNDVLRNRNNITSGDLSDGDPTVGLVGSVQVDVVRTNASSDGELQFFGLGQPLGGEIARMETGGNRKVVVSVTQKKNRS
jgi:hypothetical protein